MYIFISHSSKDASIAQELCNVIESGGHECFLAPRNIRSGYEYAAEIISGIDRADVLLLLLSENANSSPHILREIERAVSRSIPIMVYKLEDVVLSKSLEYFLMTDQWMDAKNSSHEYLLNCLNDLANNTSTAIQSRTTAVTQEVQKKSGKRVPVFFAIAAVILISVIIVSVNFFHKSGKNNNSNPSESNTELTENNNINTPVKDIQLGDTVVFGKYNDDNIHWNVIKISDDGTKAVLLAENILTFKAFDGADGGVFGRDNGVYFTSNDLKSNTDWELHKRVKGNNIWEESDIRTWLNSDKQTVTYDGFGPVAQAMADNKNGYDTESGFLYGFSDEELAAIQETTVKSKGNFLSDDSEVITSDRVFLLSQDEIQWLNDAGVSLFTSPTKEAIAKNESFYYRDYCLNVFDTTSCPWWLRDTLENSVSECYLVNHGAKEGQDFTTAVVCVEEFGIRPAITVNLNADCVKVEK